MEKALMPRKESLVGECARVLALRIRRREWDGDLPGERRLAELLQVGRDTIRAALVELEHQGLLEPARPGARRRIALNNGQAKPRRPQALKVGLLSPVPLERMLQPLLVEIDHIRGLLAARGGALHVFSPSWFHSPHPAKQLDRLIAAENCAVWILVRSGRSLQTWFEEHRLPCLIRGYPQPGIQLTHIDIDWQATARHAASTLWRLGHRQVGIMVPPQSLGGVAAAVAGAREFAETESGFSIIELPEDGSANGVVKMFERMRRMHVPPTALIAIRPRQVATVLGCAARARLLVPEDLSLVSLGREPFLEQLVPSISGYHLDPAAVARQVVRRLNQLSDGGGVTANPWLTPDLVKGDSIARPNK